MKSHINHPEKRPLALIWSLIFIAPLIVLSTTIFGLASAVTALFDRQGNVVMNIARAWAGSLLMITRVHVRVEGLENIDANASYVFCSNHLSYMDTPVVLSHIPVHFRFLAKKGLFQIPLLGTHLSQAGHIPVPREDPRAAVKTLSKAAEIIHQRHVSVLIFPEGGRSEDGELHPFKEGAAYIAIKAQVPLVPIALIGTREVLPMGSIEFHSAEVRLCIGDPVPTEGLTLRDRQELTEVAYQQIAGMLGNHFARSSSPANG